MFYVVSYVVGGFPYSFTSGNADACHAHISDCRRWGIGARMRVVPAHVYAESWARYVARYGFPDYDPTF